MAEYALKPLCNAETQWGIVYLKDKEFYLVIILLWGCIIVESIVKK